MKIWIVTVDGEPEYTSPHYTDAYARYAFLVYGFGPERVKLTSKNC